MGLVSFVRKKKILFDILLMIETFLQSCSEPSKMSDSVDQVCREQFHEI